MSKTKFISVKEYADQKPNKHGKIGVSPQYISTVLRSIDELKSADKTPLIKAKIEYQYSLIPRVKSWCKVGRSYMLEVEIKTKNHE